jgi:hypothetical protein
MAKKYTSQKGFIIFLKKDKTYGSISRKKKKMLKLQRN